MSEGIQVHYFQLMKTMKNSCGKEPLCQIYAMALGHDERGTQRRSITSRTILGIFTEIDLREIPRDRRLWEMKLLHEFWHDKKRSQHTHGLLETFWTPGERFCPFHKNPRIPLVSACPEIPESVKKR